MIISIIEGEPFAPSEKEEGIWDQRETSHPSSSIPCAVLCRRAAGGSPLSLQNYDGRPIFQIRYKFGRGVRKRRRKEEEETSLNLCGKTVK